MKPEPFELVRVGLGDCAAGWIRLTVSAGDAAVDIRLSEPFDPIPDFIRWLEALQTGVAWCGFFVDEEGREKHFHGRARWHGRCLLTISEDEGGPVVLQAVVHRRQLIEAIYRGFQDFGKSPEYVAEEWGRKTVRETLAGQTRVPGPELEAFLRGLNESDFARFCHAVLPGQTLGMPDEVRWMKTLNEILEFARRPGNAIVARSIEEAATRARPGSGGLLEEERESRIAEFLESRSRSWSGTPLDSLRSDVLEAYLASGRDRE